jgi:hypothetical protein
MIAGEPFFQDWFAEHPGFKALIYPALIGGVLGLAWLRNRKGKEVLQ